MRIQFLSYVYNNQYTDGRPEYFEYDKRPSPLYMRNVTKRLIMRLYTIWRRQRCGWKAAVYYMWRFTLQQALGVSVWEFNRKLSAKRDFVIKSHQKAQSAHFVSSKNAVWVTVQWEEAFVGAVENFRPKVDLPAYSIYVFLSTYVGGNQTTGLEQWRKDEIFLELELDCIVLMQTEMRVICRSISQQIIPGP